MHTTRFAKIQQLLKFIERLEEREAALFDAGNWEALDYVRECLDQSRTDLQALRNGN